MRSNQDPPFEAPACRPDKPRTLKPNRIYFGNRFQNHNVFDKVNSAIGVTHRHLRPSGMLQMLCLPFLLSTKGGRGKGVAMVTGLLLLPNMISAKMGLKCSHVVVPQRHYLRLTPIQRIGWAPKISNKIRGITRAFRALQLVYKLSKPR